MKKNMDQIIAEALSLPIIPLPGAHAYRENGPSMAHQVDSLLAESEDIQATIGNNSLQVMYDNHQHHAAFMATVFSIGGYELLARTIPWVYRAYHAHGFSYDYFIQELQAWKKVVENEISEKERKEILAVYDWMLAAHGDMIRLAEEESEDPLPIGADWLEIKNQFMAGLLDGDQHGCLALAKKYIDQTGDLNTLYLHIIQPAMYEIGRMWEKAEISVAQEHLASAIISRVMVSISSGLQTPEDSRGRAIVTTVQNEFHEIGAWMVSDMLEQDGWQVRYLGANTPAGDLLEMLDNYMPDLLVVSATMPFKLESLQNTVKEIRANPLHITMKIMVGGRVFLETPGLCEKIGADGFARNTEDAVRLARQWNKQ